MTDEEKIIKALNIISKFKERFICCFDKDLWSFIKNLEKVLGSDNSDKRNNNK